MRLPAPAIRLAVLTALTTWLMQPAVACGERSGPPNVVIIFADDLGYGDLGCYGHPTFKTPHLDRLARDGARLTNMYVPVPYCAPSRGTLLTGRYPWRHGVWSNPAPDAGIDDVGLPAKELTIAEALKPLGYRTACIGKWHLGHRPQFYPRTQGFDEYLGILYSNDMRPVQLMENEQVAEYPVVQATLTRRYTDRAIDFMRRHREQPFFLYLPHAMPHKPLAASQEHYRQSGAGLYGDVIHELDAEVGRLLKELDDMQLRNQTLVLFLSDNGPWFGGSTGGLRGMKGQTWEGGTRVPGIVRWPGRIPAGATCETPCGTIDILPTVLAAVGAPQPTDAPLDGINLLPVLPGEAHLPDRPLFAMSGDKLAAVRLGRFKLHVRPPRGTPLGPFRDQPQTWVDPRAPDGVTILAPWEQPRPDAFPGVLTGAEPHRMMLVDLEQDPAEQRDVSAEHPDVVARLTAEFNQALRTFPPELRDANPLQ